MKRQVLIGLLVLAVALSGCAPGAPADSAGAGSAAVRAWFDAPLPETRFAPPNPCQIVAHAAAPAGIARFQLLINGAPSDIPSPDPSATLAVLTRDCELEAPGRYRLQLRAQDNDGAWSGFAETSLIIAEAPAVLLPTPAAAPTDTPGPACLDRAAFVADITVPDNTSIAPGAAFTKVWRLRNDGNCPWTEEYSVVFVSGHPLGNPTPLPIPGVVQPGATVDLSLPLSAPAAAGTYRSDYQIRNPQGEHFGVGASGQTPFYVQIVVGAPAAPTPTVPAGPDTQPPSVSVSHSPPGASLPTGTSITFTANASDNVGVTRIDLWVTAPGGWPTKVRTCNNTTTCSHTGGPYNTQGNLTYYAVAADAAGHETISNSPTIQIYIVVH